jgi:fructose-bisphosphate aldolase class 1
MYAPYSDRVSLSGVAEDRVQQTEQHADLIHIAQQLVAPGKGLLAADESTSTMGRRYA